MKIFQTTIKHYKWLGVSAPQKFEKNQQINFKIVFALFFYFQNVASIIAYFLIKAKSFEEYIDSFFFILFALSLFIILLIIIWNKDRLFKLFDKLQKAMDKRE